ncbi:MFS permease [Azoarcus olearius]|uniref:MFS transporter n=1 Tax=Azoarcus sp. (strain BH72) TaxID=418699 RepID=UPI0008062FF0|nr:MFS transporter [Azoarcus olearius]ANQ85823.1 MFS permease [Azoarcus olearius]
MTPGGRLDVLREPDFRFFLSAKLLATLAGQMVGVAVGWQVYALTSDVLALGLVGLAQFAPFIVLILPAGEVADRCARTRIIGACYAVQMLAATLLLAIVLTDVRQVGLIYAVLVLLGCARAFMMPASQAVLINLVSRPRFAQAVALHSSSFHVAVIVGPLLGGVIYLAGAGAVYGLAAMLFAAALVAMRQVRGGRQPTPSATPGGRGAVFDGLRFVFSRPVVLGAISLDLFAVLFGGAVALLPAIARDVLQVDTVGMGLLRAAPAAGAALASVALVWRPIRHHVGLWMFGGVALFGIATIVFGLSHSLPLSVAALALTGAGDMVSVYVRHILVQHETPDDIRGRVSAVNSVFIGASNELGEFESGVTARLFGLVPAVVVGGCATLAVTAAWMRLFPALTHMRSFPHSAREPHPAAAPDSNDSGAAPAAAPKETSR